MILWEIVFCMASDALVNGFACPVAQHGATTYNAAGSTNYVKPYRPNCDVSPLKPDSTQETRTRKRTNLGLRSVMSLPIAFVLVTPNAIPEAEPKESNFAPISTWDLESTVLHFTLLRQILTATYSTQSSLIAISADSVLSQAIHIQAIK